MFVQRARQSGRMPGGGAGIAGSGLLIALVAGGLALNASLFNGEFTCGLLVVSLTDCVYFSGRWSPSNQVYEVSYISFGFAEISG